jgi:hypothetical protein
MEFTITIIDAAQRHIVSVFCRILNHGTNYNLKHFTKQNVYTENHVVTIEEEYIKEYS